MVNYIISEEQLNNLLGHLDEHSFGVYDDAEKIKDDPAYKVLAYVTYEQAKTIDASVTDEKLDSIANILESEEIVVVDVASILKGEFDVCDTNVERAIIVKWPECQVCAGCANANFGASDLECYCTISTKGPIDGDCASYDEKDNDKLR